MPIRIETNGDEDIVVIQKTGCFPVYKHFQKGAGGGVRGINDGCAGGMPSSRKSDGADSIQRSLLEARFGEAVDRPFHSFRNGSSLSPTDS